MGLQADKTDHVLKNFGEHGIPEVQHGGWGTGEYAYMDGTKNLALIIELLENYKN